MSAFSCRRAPRRLAALAVAALLVTTACTVDADGPDAGPDPTETAPSTSATTTEPVVLRLGVYGPDGLVAAYREMAQAYAEDAPGVEVELVTFPDHDAALAALAATPDDAPDVMLVEHSDLPLLLEDEAIQPVDALLGERGVDFGDGYQREGMTAFSSDLALQCMPHDVSPMVVYYNTDLLDLSTLGPSPEEAPTAADGWTFDLFAEAARSVATRRVKGVYVAPELEQLAPFLWSGGGSLLDDGGEPTRLDLASDENTETLGRVLDLLREDRVTPSADLLARRSSLQLFANGRLAMMLGYRDLVPQLREVEGLSFDVMPLPRVGSYRTVSSLKGFCLSAGTDHVEEAADLLAYVVGDGERIVARAGYTLPANLEVAYSADFAQSSQDPASSFVFNEGVRRSEQLPSGPEWAAAVTTTEPLVRRLFFAPVLSLEAALERIDQTSEAAFADADEARED